MTTHANQFDLSLAHQAMFTVSDASGVQIICREGSLWVTLDDDPRDVLLDAGDSFTTTEHRRALIYAIEPSRLGFAVAPPVATARRAGRPPAASPAKVTLALQPA